MTQHDIDVIPVTHDRDGSTVTVAVHRLTGGEGPTLGVVGVQHGDEWFAVRMIQELVKNASTWDFRGTLAVVPVASPPALRDGQRITQSDSDEPDLNRIWTTQRTWLSSQLVRTLTENVIDSCDALVDMHLGIWGSTWGGVCYATDLPDPEVSERSRRLAYAYGARCVEKLELMGAFPGPRSLGGYAGSQLGIPAIALEIGGAGFDLAQEREWIAEFVRGIRNLMISMGMMDGSVEVPETVLETGPTMIVSPSHGGLMIPANEPEELLRQVAAGEELARIYSPQTLEVVETLTSPADGWLFCMSRAYPVRPGGWAFAVAPADGAEWREQPH